MLSPEEEGQIRALTHLVTVLLRRISETDENWCRELLQGVRAERNSALVRDKSLDKAYDHALPFWNALSKRRSCTIGWKLLL
jgi:hypothetical protein